MKFLAEGGLDINNYSTSLRFCFCRGVHALITAAEKMSSKAAFW
jgi:hypothetical protein